VFLPGEDSSGASDSRTVYSSTRSTEVIMVSASADWRIPNCNDSVSESTDEIARPSQVPDESSTEKYNAYN